MAYFKAAFILLHKISYDFDKSYAKGKKMRTDKNMEQIALRALF